MSFSLKPNQSTPVGNRLRLTAATAVSPHPERQAFRGRVWAPRQQGHVRVAVAVSETPYAGYTASGYVATTGHYGTVLNWFAGGMDRERVRTIAALRTLRVVLTEVLPQTPATLLLNQPNAVRWIAAWQEGSTVLPDGHRARQRNGFPGPSLRPLQRTFGRRRPDYELALASSLPGEHLYGLAAGVAFYGRHSLKGFPIFPGQPTVKEQCENEVARTLTALL